MSNNRRLCYGRRDSELSEDIFLVIDVPPFPPFITNPLMKADYFTSRYGGLAVTWVTSARNLPLWHDIDAQIWKFLETWNAKR
jgi:hypothetical protein